MPIPVEHEDMEVLKRGGWGLSKLMEHCVFCATPTRYWHTQTNSPVCPCCADEQTVEALAVRKAELQREGHCQVELDY